MLVQDESTLRAMDQKLQKCLGAPHSCLPLILLLKGT